VIDVGNRSLDVGDGHDGMLIQGKLLIGKFFERSVAGGEALLQSFFRQLPFRDIACNF